MLGETERFVLVLENHDIEPLSLKSKITYGRPANNVVRETRPNIILKIFMRCNNKIL